MVVRSGRASGGAGRAQSIRGRRRPGQVVQPDRRARTGTDSRLHLVGFIMLALVLVANPIGSYRRGEARPRATVEEVPAAMHSKLLPPAGRTPGRRDPPCPRQHDARTDGPERAPRCGQGGAVRRARVCRPWIRRRCCRRRVSPSTSSPRTASGADALHCRHGFGHELRAVLSGATGTWGVLTLLREADRSAFTATDVDFVASLATPSPTASAARPCSRNLRSTRQRHRPGPMATIAWACSSSALTTTSSRLTVPPRRGSPSSGHRTIRWRGCRSSCAPSPPRLDGLPPATTPCRGHGSSRRSADGWSCAAPCSGTGQRRGGGGDGARPPGRPGAAARRRVRADAAGAPRLRARRRAG